MLAARRTLLSNRTILGISTSPSRRSMATVSKKEWFVLLPDNQGALDKRMEVRPEHISNAKALGSKQTLALGGAYLEEHPQPGQKPKIKGSVLIACADTKDEVLDLLKADIYYKNNVWDWNAVQIHPFVSAIRNSL